MTAVTWLLSPLAGCWHKIYAVLGYIRTW